MKFRTMLGRIVSTAVPTFRRFWAVVVMTALLTGLTIYLVDSGSISSDTADKLGRLALALGAGAVAALDSVLLWERFVPSRGQFAGNAVAGVVGALMTALSYLMLPNTKMVPMSRHIVITFCLALLFFIVPHIRKRGSLEMYAVRVFSNAVVSGLFSAVLFIGLSIITFTISSLFSLNFRSTIYAKLWIIDAGMVIPFLFMSGIPLGVIREEEGRDPTDYPKVLRNLVLYVITPLLAAYTLILYVYFAKILITRQWPVGLVAHLGLWYAVFTTALLYFVWPLAKENQWADGFSRYFIRAVIPLLLMVFVSIGIRVHYYGVTENRYYVIVLGAWTLGSMLYLNIVDRRFRAGGDPVGTAHSRKTILLPASLAVVAVLSVFGPWSSFAVSKWSQNRRLEGLLSKYGMISAGSIAPAAEVPAEDRNEMVAILDYFRWKHSLTDVQSLPPGFTLAQFPTLFGFEYGYSYQDKLWEYFDYYAGDRAINVEGFAHMFDFSGRKYEGTPATQTLGGTEAAYDRDTYKVSVSTGGIKVWEKDLRSYIGTIIAARSGDRSSEGRIELNEDEMQFTERADSWVIQIVITELSGSIDGKTGEPVIHQVGFYLFMGPR